MVVVNGPKNSVGVVSPEIGEYVPDKVVDDSHCMFPK
jgi:hypothetical protein